MRRAVALVCSVATVIGVGLAAASSSPAIAAAGGYRPASKLGKPYALPRQSRVHKPLGKFSGGDTSQTAIQRAEAAASARAKSTGRPVTVAGLTTETESVVANPNGEFTMRSYPVPVRVREAGRWIAVSTNLRRAGGMLSPRALPGDSVRFSSGGTGPMAVIQAGNASLALWWPRRLPVPTVAGPSATYRDALPGVNLVLTADGGAAGGFSDVLVVTSPRAAQEVSSLQLRITGRGTHLEAAKGGGLVAPLARGGSFVAPAAVMWDSGTSARGVAARAAAVAGRAGGVRAAGGPVAASSVQGPGRGALAAQVGVGVSGGGSRLRLVPDAQLLTSPRADYPLYIDPSLYLNTNGGGSLQAYDPVQSTCTSSHFDGKGGAPYDDSPVGYDDWGGSCAVGDTDYGLFQVGMSTALGASGVTIATATVNASIAYFSACSGAVTVTLSWIGKINSNTGWPGPGVNGSNTNATASYSPGESCSDTVYTDDGVLVSKGFNVIDDINAINGSPSNFTFRLWETGSEASNEDDHVQFASGHWNSDGPYLQVQFFDQPSTVQTSTMEESTEPGGTSDVYACATSEASAPAVVPTQAGNGVYTGATYSDPDGQSILGGRVHYFLASDPFNPADANSYPETTSDVSSTPVKETYSRAWDTAPIPWSWLAEQTNGATVGWVTAAYTGTAPVGSTTYGPFWTPSYSQTCYFDDYWDQPEPPTVTAGFDQSTPAAVGSTISFTITQSSNDANLPSEYVWDLDAKPATSGTIPDSQLCTTSSTTTPDCVINSSTGTATLNVVVPSPGPHLLWVYEVDSKGVPSGMSDGALADSSGDSSNEQTPAGAWAGFTFTGAADSPVSYTTGSSLQANFDSALQANAPYDNTLISNSSGAACSAFAGNGWSGEFYEPQLTAAGWNPGSQVTVDGSSFTLPTFGSCGADNLLAANQTIGTGSSAGVNGSAVTFLATSTFGEVGVPGLMTGSPDENDAALESDVTAPAVMGGTPVTGSGCLATQGGFGAQCIPATGTVNYASGCALGTSVQYTLTAPDWVDGPSDIQAVSTADEASTSGETADDSKIYAFSVPLDPACQLLSVTLPDVGEYASVASPSGLRISIPALHIFGLSVRNTTTATPVQATAQNPTGTPCAAPCATPASHAWTGAFESPIEDAYAPPSGVTWGDQTIRMALSPNISAPAGSQIRIRLSNPGFLDSDGTGPLQIGAASIALAAAAPATTAPPNELYFGGADTVTIPEGGDVYSDPLTLPFAVTAGQELIVSLFITNSTLPGLPVNAVASGGVTWFAPAGTNETQDQTGNPFTGTGSSWIGAVPVLAGVDVTTAAPASDLNGLASPGAPTVVVAGDNVTDAFSSSALGDSIDAPSKRLAGQLYSQGITTVNGEIAYGAVDAGIQSNQLLSDGTAGGGVSLVARLDRDILAEPDVGTVIIDEGLEDLLMSGAGKTAVTASDDNMSNAYAVLDNQLNAYGINVILATMTPCAGYTNSTTGTSCSTSVADPVRSTVNGYLESNQIGYPVNTLQPYCTADLDAAVTNGVSTEQLASADDAGDYVNLTWAGYAAMAGELNPANYADSPCPLSPNEYPQPPS
jgi:hypothetical protein